MAYRLVILGMTVALLTYYWNNMTPRCCIQEKLDDAYDYVVGGYKLKIPCMQYACHCHSQLSMIKGQVENTVETT